MALNFNINSGGWQQDLIRSERQKELGSNIGTALTALGDYGMREWSPLGKAYGKYEEGLQSQRAQADKAVDLLKQKGSIEGKFISPYTGKPVEWENTIDWTEDQWYAHAMGKPGKPVDLDQARRAYLKDYPKAAMGKDPISEETLREGGYLGDASVGTGGYTPGMFNQMTRGEYSKSQDWRDIESRRAAEKLARKNAAKTEGGKGWQLGTPGGTKLPGVNLNLKDLPKSLWQMVFPGRKEAQTSDVKSAGETWADDTVAQNIIPDPGTYQDIPAVPGQNIQSSPYLDAMESDLIDEDPIGGLLSSAIASPPPQSAGKPLTVAQANDPNNFDAIKQKFALGKIDMYTYMDLMAKAKRGFDEDGNPIE